MYIEHPITTQRANTYGAALEAETQAIRALSDAMAMICEGLLQREQLLQTREQSDD